MPSRKCLLEICACSSFCHLLFFLKRLPKIYCYMCYKIKLSRQAGLGATPEGLLTKVEEEVKVKK